MTNKTNFVNTVTKGDAFENRVFSKFKELIESGDFGLDSKRSYVYSKKMYKGKSGNDIVFDISIETFMPNATEYSYLTLVECKDYNSPIQVEKIRDFSHRIEDVGGHKGIFVTTSKFQSGALNIARTEKIGLAIMDDTNNLAWRIQRIGKRNYEIRQSVEDYISDMGNNSSYPFIAISGYFYYTSVIDFLSEVINQELKLPIKVPFIKSEEIEAKIQDIFKQKDRNDLQYYMRTEELIDFTKNQLKVNLNFNNVLDDEIGHCDFQNNTISITNTIEYDSPRWRFTFAHEIGHYILHYYLYEKYNVFIANDDDSNINELTNDLSKRIEIQANLFASKLLIPNKALIENYLLLHKECFLRNFPQLYVDFQLCNIQSYNYITKNIAKQFGVSQEVVKYKLIELDYLTLKNSTI